LTRTDRPVTVLTTPATGPVRPRPRRRRGVPRLRGPCPVLGWADGPDFLPRL